MKRAPESAGFERLQAQDARAERRLLWAELAALLLVAMVAGGYAWLTLA